MSADAADRNGADVPWRGSEVQALRRALLGWYRKHARDLPWRRTSDPYRIWLSEMLLQQTRVETVLNYYDAFLHRFPDVHALAAAPLEDVLHAWSGLGYYRRARHLHAAAKVIVAEFGGAFPRSAKALEQLPGVGAYTAGAIASIAFGERAAAVDGNIKRVYARLALIEQPIEERSAVERVWSLARAVLAPRAPGDFNQALMELGARVCVPKQPLCLTCPVRRWCRGVQAGRAAELPRTVKKAASPVIRARAAAVRDVRGRYLLVQRPNTGLLAGLWTLPMVERRGTRPTRGELAREITAGADGVLRWGKPLGDVRHVFTHRVLEARVDAAEVADGGGAALRVGGCGRWLSPTDFESVPLASVDRKLLRLIPGAEVRK